MPPGTELETKTLPLLESKMSEEGHGTLEGYASVKNEVDSYGDVILDGAYANLEELKSSGWSGFNHEGAVGWIVEAYEDQKGLFVKIAFHSDPESQSVRTKIKERLEAGKKVGMSIMYRTVEASYATRDEKEVRELKKIETVEAGAVLLPAAKSATVASVKDGSGTSIGEDFEAARELAEKVHGRLSDLNATCDGELTAGRKKMVEEMAQKWADLRDAVNQKSEEEDAQDATPEDIEAARLALLSSGVIQD